MCELPSVEDLMKLPLRAVVVYGARCARRVQPLYRGAPGQVDAIASVISNAESFCRGGGVTLGGVDSARLAASAAAAAYAASAAADAYATSASAVRSAADAASASVACAANAASASAAYAFSARAAFAAASAAARAAGNDSYTADDDAAAYAYADAGDAAAYAADCAAAAASACGSSSSAAVKDYAQLLSQHLGEFPELGLPIDPSEKGPLGALWPHDPPTWFRTGQS